MRQFVILALIGLALFLVPSSAPADGCFQRGAVIRQSYSGGYSYNGYGYQYYPVAVQAYVSPDFYASTSDYYRDKLLVDAVAGKTAELMGLQSQIQQLQQLMLQQKLVNPGNPINALGAPPQQGAPRVKPELYQLIQNDCIRCHGAGVYQSKGGGINFADDQLEKMDGTDWKIVHSAVCSGEMPKGGQKLRPEQIAWFREQSSQADTKAASKK